VEMKMIKRKLVAMLMAAAVLLATRDPEGGDD